MLRRYCDVCGEQISAAYKDTGATLRFSNNVVDKFDCCPNCVTEIRNFIDERQKCFGVYGTNPALRKDK